MKESDLPLVRGGKLPAEALPWLAEVERVFPGATKDIIVVRTKIRDEMPISDLSVRVGK